DQGRSAGRGLPVHGRARNDSARHVPGRRALHDALPGDELPPGTLAEAPRADGHPRQPGAALGGHRGGGRYRWRPGTGAGFRVADSSWRLGQPYLPHRILAGIGRTIPPRSVFALRSTRVNAGILRLPGVPFLFFFITHREGFPTYVSEVLKRYSLHPSAIRPPPARATISKCGLPLSSWLFQFSRRPTISSSPTGGGSIRRAPSPPPATSASATARSRRSPRRRWQRARNWPKSTPKDSWWLRGSSTCTLTGRHLRITVSRRATASPRRWNSK